VFYKERILKMLKKTLLISAFSSLILSSVSYAGKIDVVNENHKALDIKIEAEGDSKAVSKQQVSADHKSSFEVTSAQLNGKSYFSIKGDTSAFTPGGKCDHLSVDKDYKVTFLNDKMGTSCISEEIEKKEDKTSSDSK
jgi:hypothetical protein